MRPHRPAPIPSPCAHSPSSFAPPQPHSYARTHLLGVSPALFSLVHRHPRQFAVPGGTTVFKPADASAAENEYLYTNDWDQVSCSKPQVAPWLDVRDCGSRSGYGWLDIPGGVSQVGYHRGEYRHSHVCMHDEGVL